MKVTEKEKQLMKEMGYEMESRWLSGWRLFVIFLVGCVIYAPVDYLLWW